MCGWTPAAPTPWRRPQKHPTAERKASDHRFLKSTYFHGDKACLLLGSVWVNFDCLAGLELLQACKAVTCLNCTLVNRCTGKDVCMHRDKTAISDSKFKNISQKLCWCPECSKNFTPTALVIFFSYLFTYLQYFTYNPDSHRLRFFLFFLFSSIFIFFLIREGGRKKLETSGRGWPASALIWMRNALQLFS